jgi:crossover junction endodeoxyribonuclease RuvC
VIVLGVDPGTAALGYGILERTGGRLRPVDFGVVVTTADRSLPERLHTIHDALCELIELHRPTIIGVERLFFTRNAQTAFAVGQARGVVLLAAAQHHVAVSEATPNEVKTAVAGYGAADKEQVSRMVAVVLGMRERPTPDDAADALAVAIWAAHSAAGSGVGPGSGRGLAAHDAESAPVLDRSAIAPMAAGRTPYEQAVADALAAERRSARARASGG